MPISCPQCHARIPDDVSFCPGCGRRMWLPGQESAKPAQASSPATTPAVDVWAIHPTQEAPIPLKDRLIATLGYITFIPAIVLVMVPAFKRNRFIRFHAFQSILLTVSAMMVTIAVRILFSILTLIPAIGFLMAWLTMTVVALGLAMVWLVLLVKALQGETFRLPVIGNLAGKA